MKRGPASLTKAKTCLSLFSRIIGDIPAGPTYYFYDGEQIVVEQNGTGRYDWTQVNFWGQYIDELLFFVVPTEEATTTYRVLSDLLYRSVATTDTSNNIVEAYDCDAYGNTICYSGPGTDDEWFIDDDVTTDNPINTTIFTGRQFDPESSNAASQIYYYRARYFSPQIGRFLSRDPLGSPLMMGDATEPSGSAELKQGPNLYWYVGDNSINRVDPTGLLSATMKIWITYSGISKNADVVIYAESDCCNDIQFIQLTTNILGNTVPDVAANPSYAPFYPRSGEGPGWADMNDAPGPGVEYTDSTLLNIGIAAYNTLSRAQAWVFPRRQDFVTCAICNDDGPNKNKVLECLHWTVLSDGIAQKHTAGPYSGS